MPSVKPTSCQSLLMSIIPLIIKRKRHPTGRLLTTGKYNSVSLLLFRENASDENGIQKWLETFY